MSTTQNKPVDNGVNVEALLAARQALTEAPAAAQFKWRASCDWIKGTHSRTSVEGFYDLLLRRHCYPPISLSFN